jgi:regulator of nucleoside diphosphate kinase
MGRDIAKQRRNSELLDAAEKLFLHKGFSQTTMEDVAREAGVSVGTLYNTFQGKEALYSLVAERIGSAVMDRLTSAIQVSSPDDAILDVIRLRLYNFTRDRLFFQPYSFPAYLGVEPRPSQLDQRVNRLHENYVQLIERLFTRYAKSVGAPAESAVRTRVYLDGLVNAFMGYWTVAPQSDLTAKAARQIREMLYRGVTGPGTSGFGDNVPEGEQMRTTYVSRFDFDRLSELIEVVRVFGREEWLETAQSLGTILKNARVALPNEVPPDVVTMNSRVSLRAENGESEVVSLVFPRDMQAHPGCVCILDHLGVELFGRRIGDTIVSTTRRGSAVYQLERILYQPEAAGDFHL